MSTSQQKVLFHGRINVFEHTIRVLGGLLSAYSLTEERVFLEKATLVGEALLGAFPHRIPCGVLIDGVCHSQPWANGKSINAEVGTLAIVRVIFFETSLAN